MTDAASDIVLSRLLRKIDKATPAELPALTSEFARLKPPASPRLGDDYISPEKQVIAKIVAQDDKQEALFELVKLTSLGGPNPEDNFNNRHSLSVPAAQAWSTLLTTLPNPKERAEIALEALTFAKADIMKDVASAALLQALERMPVLGPMEIFALKQVQGHAAESGNGALKLMVRDFNQARVLALIAENAKQPAPSRS
jgi:hypothetical protein